MHYNNIFNNNTINVFTDGSVITNPITNETIGCPGSLIVKTDNDNSEVIDTNFIIIRNATNNITELYAILLGLYSVVYLDLHKKYNINLFSDSQLCINSLRTWIFNWVNNMHDNVMYGSAGTPVSNQQIISHIISFIYTNEIKINLYHQKGHVTSTKDSIKNACSVFMTSNKLFNVDERFIIKISDFNNEIDILTKRELIQFSTYPEYNIRYKKECNPMKFDIKGVDMKLYGNLINKI